MKSRIFIAMHYLEIGGAESALVGLLQTLDYSRVDVDLFLYAHRGEMLEWIPKEVNLLPEISAYSHIEAPIITALKAGEFGVVWGRLKAKWQYQKYANRKHPKDNSAIFQYVDLNVLPFLPSLHNLGYYDLAISFVTPHGIVLEKVKAHKKIAWIHTDYSTIDIDVEKELPTWNGYDHIASISEKVSANFLSVFPSLAKKIVLIENIISPAFIKRRANAFDAQKEFSLHFSPSSTKPRPFILLSIGRFCEAKNYDNIPDIACRLLKRGLDFRWFLIGYGDMESLIRQRIQEAGVEHQVIILGKRTNPYPYIKGCDIYIQPSRYEGKSITVREAQILCKPTIITNYLTAESQIKDGEDGIIVPMDNEGCAKGIADVIENKNLQAQLIDFLQSHDYGNENETAKIYRLLNDKGTNYLS